MHLTSTLGAGFLALAASQLAADSSLPTTLEYGALGPQAAIWQLAWDDSVDDELEAVGKQCAVTLEAIDGVVTGRFEGPVLGAVRTATFTGELAGGGELLLLQQREPGYVCSYQLSSAEGGWRGTWRDTNGAAGTVVLMPRPAMPRVDSPSIELRTTDSPSTDLPAVRALDT